MSCFSQFIGVRDCNIVWTPSSGLYIDDLAGVSVNSAANISVDSTGLQLLLDKIAFAAKLVTDEALNMIPNIDFAVNADYLSRGCFSGSSLASEAVEKGVTIEKTELSPLSQIVINTIYIKSKISASNKDVNIYDNGMLVQTFTVDLVADQETVIENVCYTATSNKVQILIDNSDIEPYVANTQYNYWNSCECLDCTGCSSKYVDVSQGVGVTAEILIQCDKEKAACRIVNSLKYAVLYKAGVLVMDEFLATDRLNFLAIHSKEWATQRKEEWEREYIEKVNNAMHNVRNIIDKIDKHCVACKDFEVGFLKMW